MLEIRHYTLNVFFGNPISNSQVKAILHGTMDKMKAGIQCRGMDIRKRKRRLSDGTMNEKEARG